MGHRNSYTYPSEPLMGHRNLLMQRLEPPRYIYPSESPMGHRILPMQRLEPPLYLHIRAMNGSNSFRNCPLLVFISGDFLKFSRRHPHSTALQRLLETNAGASSSETTAASEVTACAPKGFWFSCFPLHIASKSSLLLFYTLTSHL